MTQLKLSSQANYHTFLLAEMKRVGNHEDTTALQSDGKRVDIHSVILNFASQLLSDLLPSSESNLFILPGFSTILPEFVRLLYTGQTNGLTEQDTVLLASLCDQFGMNTSLMNSNKNVPECDNFKVQSDHLKVESELVSEVSDETFNLRMPVSRVDQRGKSLNVIHVFSGFKRRVQNEYNESPVGPYEGPYDQDPQVPLVAQLPKTQLNYAKYTNFLHSQKIGCKIFRIKQNNENFNDLERIKALEIMKESTDKFKEPDDEKVIYTCKMKHCLIPCPCHPCSTDIGQCPEHQICHFDLFDETDHVFSVRTTELSCTEKDFFKQSYVLKYPGIPKSCPRCKIDLLHHKCYHLKFHQNCKFCKLYQYKLFPKSIVALREREKKEQIWYKSVCPYCDKKFIEPYQRRKHVDLEHKKNKIKCTECKKSFQCQQSLDYHKLSQHTQNILNAHICNICNKSFIAKVTLDSHIKYKHSDDRKFECTKCDSKFKQKKSLNRHSRIVHGLDPREEDYWQDWKRNTFDCKKCTVTFKIRKDLEVHIKEEHNSAKNNFTCDQCSNSYKYEKNLKQHKLEKHGKEEIEYTCPDCGKLFAHKRNMERHRLTHATE